MTPHVRCISSTPLRHVLHQSILYIAQVACIYFPASQLTVDVTYTCTHIVYMTCTHIMCVSNHTTFIVLQIVQMKSSFLLAREEIKGKYYPISKLDNTAHINYPQI